MLRYIEFDNMKLEYLETGKEDEKENTKGVQREIQNNIINCRVNLI
jgi:hypothetical protein